MYIMITSVCNMSCAHCCMSCGKNYKGQHMEQYIYDACLRMAGEYGDTITLGGGEPTLHPQFNKYLAQAIQADQNHDIGCIPWFATNGSNTKKTLALMYASVDCEYYDEYSFIYDHACISYTGEPLFYMAVSQDQYHDPIDPVVFETAKKLDIEIRNTSHNISKTGHASHGDGNICSCETVQVKPDGSMYLCGCDEAPYLGNVYEEPDLEMLNSMGSGRCVKYIDEDCVEAFKDVDMNNTNSAWVYKNIPIKAGKEHHPDTHREPLEIYKEAC